GRFKSCRSDRLQNEPFGENVEGLFHSCGRTLSHLECNSRDSVALGATVSASNATHGGNADGRSTRITGACFHKTQRAVPTTHGIEGSLPPRSYANLAAGLAVYFLGRQAIQRLSALKYRVEVVHDEIKCLGRGMRFPDRRNVQDLKGDRAAVEVAPRTRLQTPHKPEQLTV